LSGRISSGKGIPNPPLDFARDNPQSFGGFVARLPLR
jgi:hypothetical protein